MELHALAGQLYIVDGLAQEGTAAPGLVAQPAPRKAARSREQDFLFVHLTIERPNAEVYALVRDLTSALVTDYYQQSGGITTALRHAISHINEHLLRWNVTHTGQSRDGAITCGVLRDDALVVAQVGAAVAFLGRNFGVERIPASEPERTAPLGRTASLDIRMNHYRLQPGDMLLLADPLLGPLPTAAVQPALVDTEVVLGLQELTDMVGMGSGRLLLVEFSDEAPPELSDLGMIRPSPSGSLTTAPAPLPQREGQPAPPRPPLPETARHATAQAARGVSIFTGGLAAMLRALRPPPDPTAPPLNAPLYAALAILIPILMAAIITSVFFQRGQVAEFSQLRQEIATAVQAGQAAEDTATQRAYYNQVLILAARAEAIRPNDGGIANQRQVAMSALDRLDGITRLNGALLYAYPETSLLTAVVIRPPYNLNGDIFVLDEGQNRVLRHPSDPTTLTLTAEQPEIIVFGGQVVQSHTVGKITDLLWRPRGSSVSRDGLAMLDSRGQLISYYTNFGELRTTPFGLASQWRTPVSVKGFSERVYVLDPEAERIWRYYPDGDALQIQEGAPAIEFSDPANLGLATDFAINQQDGSVLVVYGDGHLRRFANGRTIWTEQDLRSGGLASPLVGPTVVRVVGQGLNSSVFVLDPPSGRLLQLSLGGTLLAQYRIRTPEGLELLTRATDFAVTEEPLRIFITTPQALYVATLN